MVSKFMLHKVATVCQECLEDSQYKEPTFPCAAISVCSNRDLCTNALIGSMSFVHGSKIPESAALDLLNMV
jgi:hypothetical protein